MRLIACCGPDVNWAADSDDIKRCVGQITRDLGIVPSTVSHHIKELHQAGLIHMERRGQKIDCWVDRETLQRLTRFLTKLQAD